VRFKKKSFPRVSTGRPSFVAGWTCPPTVQARRRKLCAQRVGTRNNGRVELLGLPLRACSHVAV
jgi:hypothetical protein